MGAEITLGQIEKNVLPIYPIRRLLKLCLVTIWHPLQPPYKSTTDFSHPNLKLSNFKIDEKNKFQLFLVFVH